MDAGARHPGFKQGPAGTGHALLPCWPLARLAIFRARNLAHGPNLWWAASISWAGPRPPHTARPAHTRGRRLGQWRPSRRRADCDRMIRLHHSTDHVLELAQIRLPAPTGETQQHHTGIQLPRSHECPPQSSLWRRRPRSSRNGSCGTGGVHELGTTRQSTGRKPDLDSEQSSLSPLYSLAAVDALSTWGTGSVEPLSSSRRAGEIVRRSTPASSRISPCQ
jgi:hypothetical protein